MAKINGVKMNNSKLPEISMLLQAGIDPRTGLPIKLGSDKAVLKEGTKKFLRLIDEQDAVNRYV